MIYLDVSAAVHRRAGLGRYAESLARALVAADRSTTLTAGLKPFDQAHGRPHNFPYLWM